MNPDAYCPNQRKANFYMLLISVMRRDGEWQSTYTLPTYYVRKDVGSMADAERSARAMVAALCPNASEVYVAVYEA